MPHRMSFGRALIGAGALLAAVNLSGAAVAVTPEGCFQGVWMVNEQLTERTRPPRSPMMLFFTPWSANGWVLVSGINGEEREGRQSAELNLGTFDGKMYPIFGSDPREGSLRKMGDFAVESLSVREDEPERERLPSLYTFSADCTRLTWTRPSGERSYSGNPNLTDKRVYDKLAPHTLPTTMRYFGAWQLNRAASKLTRPPDAAETVVLVPWGANGWAYVAISDGYQPEDFKKGATNVNANRPFRVLYWTTWDGRPAYTHGFDPRQVRVTKVGDNRFDLVFDRIHQPWQRADTGSITFSADGKRMTETRDGDSLVNFPPNGVIAYQSDVRVYDKIDSGPDWPGNVRVAMPPQQ